MGERTRRGAKRDRVPSAPSVSGEGPRVVGTTTGSTDPTNGPSGDQGENFAAIKTGPPLVKFRPISELVPYAANARTHDETNVRKLMGLVMEFGFTNPVLADKDGIVAGHGRVLAVEKLHASGKEIRLAAGGVLPAGMIPIIDCTGWTKAQRRAYILADNRSALDSTWDTAMLASEMMGLEEDGFDLALTGFDKNELEKLFDSPEDKSPGDGESKLGDGMTYSVIVDFDNETAQGDLLARLEGEGLKCRLLIS